MLPHRLIIVLGMCNLMYAFPIITARRHANAEYVMALCFGVCVCVPLSVCHKSVFY